MPEVDSAPVYHQMPRWSSDWSMQFWRHILIVCVGGVSFVQNNGVSDLTEELLNSTRYNSRTRPSSDKGQPLDIYMNINVNDISSISEVKMEYSMTLYLRQIWRDERLSYNSSTYNRNLTLNHNQFDRLWTPDVFIRNLKAGVFHTITVPNRLIRLSPDGSVLYSQRLTLTLACDMVLDRYPMDNQTCNIEFGSYAYTTEDIIYHWRNDTKEVEMNSKINLPEYSIMNVTHEVCNTHFGSTGSFPCLRASFHLERRLKAYILTTYLPSFLVVLLSWLSFWIDLESAPARTSLSILTILTITTQSSGMLRSMPAGSITKAIDVWMATCLVFVFGAFIEYSIVNTLARKQKAKMAKLAKMAAAKKSQMQATNDVNVECECRACSQETLTLTVNGWPEIASPPYLAHPQNLSPITRHRLQPIAPTTSASTFCSKSAPASAKRNGNLSAMKSQASYTLAGGGRGGRGGEGGGKTGGLSEKAVEYSSYAVEMNGNKAVLVETISRVLFPVMFLIFNLVYWPLYLT